MGTGPGTINVFLSMSRCSTHDPRTEMTEFYMLSHVEFEICFESSL